MADYIIRADLLKEEAGKLLEDLNLVEVLRHYGDVLLTGSHQYNLMTKRDIDICVSIENPSLDVAFALGRELSMLPWVSSMYFRNEYILQTPGNPLAMFWCVDVYPPASEKWKVDILIAMPIEVNRVVRAGAALLQGLDEEKRAHILKIKGQLSTTKDYGITFRSTDIYEAVMVGGVNDLAGWKAWWKGREIKDREVRKPS